MQWHCGMADLGVPCFALPGLTLHTCTICARTFHHLCAGEAASWDSSPPCKAMRDSAQPVQRAVPPNAGDGEAAGGRRAAEAAPASAGRGIGGVAAPTAAPPKGKLASCWNKTAAAPPRLATKPAAAKGPSPAVGRAAAAAGPEWWLFLPLPSHKRIRRPARALCGGPCVPGVANKRRSGARVQHFARFLPSRGHWKTTWSLRSCSSTTTGLALAFRSASATQRLLHSGAAARWRENRRKRRNLTCMHC